MSAEQAVKRVIEPRSCLWCHALFVPGQPHSQKYCKMSCRVAAHHSREVEAMARELVRQLYGERSNG
jgi:hypothetical protein